MRVRVCAIALVLVASGCTTGDREPPVQPTAGTATTTGTTASPGASAPNPVNCAHIIGGVDAPDSDYTIVGDAVAVTTGRVLQANPNSVDGVAESAFFAKDGLLVRRGHTVQLGIGDGAAGRAWLGWGSPATPSAQVGVGPCDQSTHEWTAFAGGYWVLTPGCLPVQVSVAGGPAREVLVPVGSACPGTG
ncbi:hypothetical protein C1I95_24140 [Micromonospora craterilacus]|uniref:Uncharacterized protein n=1 Tax=Micromonospora craterilacus TaxID=1655439 RepID=A0A2W2E8Z6_9ACTN|nr:hypothetical protein [Micromonospora craterilacus]PZG13199.1 hypothetical protein C1I95_24140 [Micromonospora craterilacus]